MATVPSSRLVRDSTSVFRCSQLRPAPSHELQHYAILGDARLDRVGEPIDPLAGDRRDQHEAAVRILTRRKVGEPL